MISPRETHSPRPQRPPYLPRDRASRKRPRRRRRRGRREYAAADDKAGDGTTDMYVDKDEVDSDGGVGGEGRGNRCCDASAVPSRVAPASLTRRTITIALRQLTRRRSRSRRHRHAYPLPSCSPYPYPPVPIWPPAGGECRIRSRR